MRFATFVGIDQTGAVVAGRPRPLSAARLVRVDRGGAVPSARWTLEPGQLRSASREDVLAFAKDDAPAIAIDAVLGLPAACWSSKAPFGDAIWRLMCRASRTDGYGRTSAESFFASFPFDRHAPLPLRACDALAKATSVFATRPFQKNVQTGTFRIWKDLTRDGPRVRWLNVWPFDDLRTAPRRRPWLFEGYPSFLWTRLFGFPRRSPERFAQLIARARALGVPVHVRRSVLSKLMADADLADAAVLSIGAACLATRGRLFRPVARFSSRTTKIEGWIMGLPRGGPW